MKARSFLVALTAMIVGLLLLALGLWFWLFNPRPLRVADQPLDLPAAARFFPRKVAFSMHWRMDVEELPQYAKAVAPAPQRKNAREKVARLRDGAFALAGIDYESEFTDWLAPEISFALLERQGTEESGGWLLALQSRNQEGAENFLKRFWQARSLAGVDLQVNKSRGVSIISGKGSLSGRSPKANATALIGNEILLVASSGSVIEEALDISQIPNQNQLEDKVLEEVISRLGDGVALFTASPAGLNFLFGVPLPLVEQNQLKGLVAALKFDGSDCLIEATLGLDSPIVEFSNDVDEGFNLLGPAGGLSDVLAITDDPSRFVNPNSDDVLGQLIAEVIANEISKPQNFAVQNIMKRDHGPLIFLHYQEGWLLGTPKEMPEISAINSVLMEKGMTLSELNINEEPLKVWTKLVAEGSLKDANLNTEIAVILEQDLEKDWWGKTLSSLQQRKDVNELEPRLRQLREMNNQNFDFKPSQQIALGALPARDQLQRWKLWRLAQTFSGFPLQPSVQGLSMVIGNANNSSVQIKARLSLG